MAKIPAYCRHCKLRFNTTSFVSGSGLVTMENCGVSCPLCGEMADITDGTYTLRDEINNFFKFSQFSSAELKTLSRIIEKAQREKTPAPELAEIIDKEIPQAAGLKEFLFRQGFNSAFIVGLIIAAIMWYYPKSAEPGRPATPSEPEIKKLECPRNAPEVKASKRSTRRNRNKSKMAQRNPNKNPK